jgi:hypothetical protein
VTVRCDDKSMAAFPGAYTDPGNLVVGPLVLMGGSRFTPPSVVRRFGGNKFPLLVRNRHRVTVEVRSRGTALTYDPGPDGPVTLEDGHRVMRFVACRRRSGSRADGRPVTFWSGFVLTAAPRCVRLRVWVDEEASPRRAGIPLGRKCGA